METNSNRNTAIVLIVSALGYFVDIYDLILFSIVRIPSLQTLGVEGESLMSNGVLLLNMQMSGMLIGGIIWGVIGDKKGRLSVLFGSIFAYSIANLANGFVNDITTYALLRFLAGIGLAGELGAGVTLVAEIMPKESRGYGTMIIAAVGIFGAVAAAFVAELFDWRVAYFIGGGMGLLLLILRLGVYESGMYNAIKFLNVSRGNFLLLFRDKKLFLKYIYSIAIGVPIWYIVGVLITFSPEISKALKFEIPVNTGAAITFCYLGLAFGDILSGSLSQIFKTRKKIVKGFIIFTTINIVIYLFFNQFGREFFYAMCFILGLSGGYWAVFVTNAAEQFGTNIRATVTTTAPNFVRGAVVPATLLFHFLTRPFGIIYSALFVGMLCILVAYLAARNLEETYGKDLNYLEVS